MQEAEMKPILQKAEVLIEALPYIQKFNRKIIVVKYGGSAMSNAELQKNVIKDVTLLKLVGFTYTKVRFLKIVLNRLNAPKRIGAALFGPKKRGKANDL